MPALLIASAVRLEVLPVTALPAIGFQVVPEWADNDPLEHS